MISMEGSQSTAVKHLLEAEAELSAMDATGIREQRGLATAALRKLTRKDAIWLVPSQQSGQHRCYTASPDPAEPFCNCPDFGERQQPCKHVFRPDLCCDGKTPMAPCRTRRQSS
jgi:SWIM zinc finger